MLRGKRVQVLVGEERLKQVARELQLPDGFVRAHPWHLGKARLIVDHDHSLTWWLRLRRRRPPERQRSGAGHAQCTRAAHISSDRRHSLVGATIVLDLVAN